MPKIGKYNINEIYTGGYSSLQPDFGGLYLGYNVRASTIGSPTSIQTANQLKEVSQRLNEGIVPIELQPLNPEVFDQIPKQHFKEINRLAKLTGAKISLHAPIIEPSGMTKEGWSEISRQLAERQLNDVVEKALELDDKGRVPITIHSAGIPGKEYIMTPQGRKIERLIVINQETKKMVPLEEEKKFYPGEDLKNGVVFDVNRELRALNNSEWVNNLTNLEFYKKEADEVMRGALIPLAPIVAEENVNLRELRPTPEQEAAFNQLGRAEIFMNNVETSFNSIFNKAYQFSDEKGKERLKKVSERWGIEGEKIEKEKEKNFARAYILKSQLLDESIRGIKQIPPPKLYIPIEDFAMKHSTETIANVAFNAYKKHPDKSPQINIENLYTGMAFSSGEEMKKFILDSREKFVERARKDGVSEGTARQMAEKMIGMTLDVGHLNIYKKQGYTDEDLLKEVKEISKFVKHVHLTDNFGYGDSHLPPGMGNVPFKKILEELEKKGYQGTKIVEAGAFVQHFQTSPHPYALEALGSPVYAMKMAPYWNQISNTYQGYYGGYGLMLPSINYESFGGGFSQLPGELGGQRAGAGGSRMSGRPME